MSRVLGCLRSSSTAVLDRPHSIDSEQKMSKRPSLHRIIVSVPRRRHLMHRAQVSWHLPSAVSYWPPPTPKGRTSLNFRQHVPKLIPPRRRRGRRNRCRTYRIQLRLVAQSCGRALVIIIPPPTRPLVCRTRSTRRGSALQRGLAITKSPDALHRRRLEIRFEAGGFLGCAAHHAALAAAEDEPD
jgi:hypothetical protein